MRVGPYEAGEELGRGAFGVVHRARHVETGEVVALKVVRGVSEVALRRAKREVEALARLEHESVVRIRAWQVFQDGYWLAMELLEGSSLQRRLNERGPLPVEEAVALTAAVARGLQHAHERGVVHRDLKPDNVVLRRDGGAVLTDFNLAADLAADATRLTRSGAFLGTPGYWPPEQARGERDRIGPRSDVYALGATLHALLTGAPPFVEDWAIGSRPPGTCARGSRRSRPRTHSTHASRPGWRRWSVGEREAHAGVTSSAGLQACRMRSSLARPRADDPSRARTSSPAAAARALR